jgi:DNA sulfur modification protein DndD
VDIIPESEPGIFVFIGKNHLGKSNFLNAICWCLYEELPFKESIDDSDNDDEELLNKDAKEINIFNETTVEIDIQYGEKLYRFIRKQRPTQKSYLAILLKKGEQWESLDQSNYRNIIESFLPKDLREYFIFAGENVEELFSAGYEKKLKSGVWKLSHIEVLDRAIDHLGKISTTVQKFASKSNMVLFEPQKKKDDLIRQNEQNKDRFKKIEEEVVNLKVLRKNFKEKFETFRQYKNLTEKRSDLESRIEEIDKDNHQFKEEINNLITSNIAFLYLKKTFENVKDKIEEEQNSGFLPPSINSDFIEKLIQDNTCICGNKITKGSKEFNNLKKILESVEDANRLKPILDDKIRIVNVINNINNFLDRFESIRNKKIENSSKRDRLDRDFKNIKEELKNVPNGEVGNIEDSIERIERSIDEINAEKARIQMEIERDEKEIESLNNLINNELKKQKENEASIKKIEIIAESIEKLNKVRGRITGQIRTILSKNIEKYFKNLFWDIDDYEIIQFSDNYKLEIRKRGSDSNEVDFSKGEKKVLGLSTLKAIAELSGFKNVPIFFDAPLTNLDTEVQENVLKMLPSFAPDKQVFVFNLDDREMINFAESNIKKNHIFWLVKDLDYKRSTKIIQK